MTSKEILDEIKKQKEEITRLEKEFLVKKLEEAGIKDGDDAIVHHAYNAAVSDKRCKVTIGVTEIQKNETVPAILANPRKKNGEISKVWYQVYNLADPFIEEKATLTKIVEEDAK